MKEMNYTEQSKKEILHSGTYEDYNFYIVSYGIHPCAYIEIPKNHRWFGKKYNDEDIYNNVLCHYGLTYSGNLHHVLSEKESNGKWFIGWDYGHFGDYAGYSISTGLPDDGKKWTTKEIFEEVKAVITQIKLLDQSTIKYEEGEVVLYQNGDRFELGIVKKVCGGDDYFVNYHTGDTAARTNARNLHKIANAYAFHIIRLDPNGNERK